MMKRVSALVVVVFVAGLTLGASSVFAGEEKGEEGGHDAHQETAKGQTHQHGKNAAHAEQQKAEAVKEKPVAHQPGDSALDDEEDEEEGSH